MGKVHCVSLVVSLALGLWLSGCAASDGSVFEDRTANAGAQALGSSLSFSIFDSAFPDVSLAGVELSETELPASAIYLQLSSVRLGEDVFQLDVRIRDLDSGQQQIYDMPLNLRYNRSVLNITDSATSSISLIEGPEGSRLRAYLEPQFAVLVGRNDSNPLVNYPNCQNFCGYYLIGHSLTREVQPRSRYRGTMMSLIVNIQTPGNIDSPIGFELSESKLLDFSGNPIPARFFGGVLRRRVQAQ